MKPKHQAPTNRETHDEGQATMSSQETNRHPELEKWQTLANQLEENTDNSSAKENPTTQGQEQLAAQEQAISALMAVKEEAWLRATQRWDELAQAATTPSPMNQSVHNAPQTSESLEVSQTSKPLDPALLAWALKASRQEAPAWRRGLAYASEQWRALMDDTARLQQQLQAAYQQLLAPHALVAKSAAPQCQIPCALLTGETAPAMGLHPEGFWMSVLPHKRYHLHVYLPYLASIALLQLADTPEADDTIPPALLYPSTIEQHQAVSGCHQLLDLALTETGTRRFLAVFSPTPFAQWPLWESTIEQSQSPEESAEKLAILVLQEIERLTTWQLLVDCEVA